MSKVTFKNIDKVFDANVIYVSDKEPVHASHELIQSADRNTMRIEFSSTTEYNDLISVYTNEDALSEISISENDETYVYLSYVIPMSLSLERYKTTEEVEKFGPDRWVMSIAQLTDSDKQFRKIIGVAAKSSSCLTLEENKDVKIQISKEDLEKYLKDHPLISNCKDNVYKEYTVTTDKQNQFAAQFAVFLANKMAGVEDIFTWNEKGKPCIPWDESSCIKWMNAAKAYTKPLVQAQQDYEVRITEMTDKADVEKASIDYSTVKTANGKPEWIGHTDAEVIAAEEIKSNLPDDTTLL